MSQQASGSNDARNAEETQTIVHLNEDCWRVVIDYLDVGDQLRFASSNVCFGEIFKTYASHRYKHIDESLASRINDDYLKQLLPIIGEHLVSYDSELGDHQHLCLLGRHCTSLKNLKINLNSLKLGLTGADWWRTSVVYNFENFPCLQKLKLKAVKYNGKGLHVLDQLEYLELVVLDGLDAQSLADCWQTMTQLRYLKYGHHIKNLNKKHFEILVTNCKQLERLAFGIRYLDSTVPYELVCHLPRLQHLQVRHGGSLRDSFIEGLINKQGSPLESLILKGGVLSEEQVQHLCNISTLKELEVSCDTVPLADLLKLKNLLYLHISMPITTDQILDLLKGLPHLKVLNLRDEVKQFNDSSFVNSVRAWVSEQRKQRGKITIFAGYTNIHDVLYVNPLVELTQGNSGNILINKEPF